MKNLLLFALLFPLNYLFAQPTAPERLLDFKVESRGDASVFTPIMPPLMQKPGAPKAYWSYFWEFGDGTFSREENPTHRYISQGDFIVSLDATAHYDDGKKAKKKKKPLHGDGTPRLSDAQPEGEGIFDPKARQMVAMYSYSKPKAEEEITLILSYRNMGLVNTDGRLHLFFNEKKYPNPHFELAEARTHYGEMADMSTSQVLPLDNTLMMGWVALPLRSSGGVSTTWSGELPPSMIIQEMLNNARGAYRTENAWRFTELQAGEKRNLFLSMAGTANMLRDTTAMIHLEAIFAPFDPAVAPEKFIYEIEIVGSHDPNAIAVSDNRVNYRTLGSKKLDYKIQFQNNGEGPASKVEVKVEVPNGLKTGAMRPVAWYPKCPICPKTPTNKGCLDTASVQDGIVFTFRNIYLPGSRQKDVDNRDSTKGFVKYRIEATRSMAKRPFSSRAKIVFDKNPPIYTNYTKTRFKVGISPGLKVGYGIDPNFASTDGADAEPVTARRNGYTFLGASLSPFKSWRVYPQIELLTGIKSRIQVGESDSFIDTIGKEQMPGMVEHDTFTVLKTNARITERGFVSFEVPFLLRKNFSRAFGAGLGFSPRIILEHGADASGLESTTYVEDFNGVTTELSTTTSKNSLPYKDTRFQYTAFVDLTVGAVRAGPNLGIRGGFVFGENKKPEPFVQLSVELKL